MMNVIIKQCVFSSPALQNKLQAVNEDRQRDECEVDVGFTLKQAQQMEPFLCGKDVVAVLPLLLA